MCKSIAVVGDASDVEFDGTFKSVVSLLDTAIQSGGLSKNWKWLEDDLKNKTGVYDKLRINYEVVKPKICELRQLVFKKQVVNEAEVQDILSKFCIRSIDV